MGEKLVLCFILIFLQGGIEDRLEVGEGGSGSGGRVESLGHRSDSQKEDEGGKLFITIGRRV